MRMSAFGAPAPALPNGFQLFTISRYYLCSHIVDVQYIFCVPYLHRKQKKRKISVRKRKEKKNLFELFTKSMKANERIY